MASGQCPGANVRIYAVEPNGKRHPLFKGVNEQTGPGGAPDGVQATVKANELPIMPVAPLQVTGGNKIIAVSELKVSDGIDASDCVIQIPILRNGAPDFLSASDLGFTTDYPASTPAGVELQLGAGYTVPQNDMIQVGGNRFFISIENDTA